MEYKKGYVFGINDEHQHIFQDDREMKEETREEKKNLEEEKEVQRCGSQ